MKTITSFIFTLIIVSCSQIPKEERVLITGETDAIFTYSIPKAGCTKCQRVVEDGLHNEKGVKQSILNLHTKQVSIVFNPDMTTSKTLEKKVTSLMGKIPCK